MTQEKTELPTKKKLRDAAKRGQIFKSKDLIATLLLLAGIFYLNYYFPYKDLITFLHEILKNVGLEQLPDQITKKAFLIFIKSSVPLIILIIVATAVPSLFQSGFILATKAFKLNFNALNPVNGFKKIWSLRNLKDFVKAILYLFSFFIASCWVWYKNKHLLFAQLYGSAAKIFFVFGQIVQSVLLIVVSCIVLILLLDLLAEYFLYLRDNKMDKQEIKREYKEQESNPEVKSRRRSLHHEILSDQDKININGSKMVIVNPSHIAIGIFFQPEIFPAPVISFIEKNERALLTRRYAKEQDIPIIQDIPLARRLYKTHVKHSLVSLDELDAILRILVWLQQIENAHSPDETRIKG